MLGAVTALFALGAGEARADDAVGTLRMLPNELFMPTVAVQTGVTGTLDPRYPLLAEIELGLRGLPGAKPGTGWLGVDGGVTFDGIRTATGAADASDPVAFQARVTPWRRWGQSQPIVVAQDLRVGAVSVGRDRPLGVELSGLVQVLDWAGGFYLPANHAGDIDARVVIGVRSLGARWRRYSGRNDDFLGAALGGLSGELVYGRRFGRLVTVTGHLGARADWSIGTRDGFAAQTDTEVWLGGVVEVGPHDSLRLLANTRTWEDNSGGAAYLPGLTLAWRSTW